MTNNSNTAKAKDSITSLFTKILLVCPVFTLLLLLLLGPTFFFVAGLRGLLGVLLGCALSVFFISSTVLSVMISNRFRGTSLFLTVLPISVMFGWVIKVVIFLIFIFILRDQMWFDEFAFFLCITLICLGSLIIDALLILRSGIFDNI